MSNNTNNIQIGPKFFQNEKRAYNTWQLALVRELCQNSGELTIGSTRIDINITNGNIISVKDNGHGMSRETLQNVFLVLGETTKNGADTCGGFGIARNLICFAQNSYKIISSDYIVNGCGASYTIEDNAYTKGCEFIIETEHCDWERYIKQVLSRSHVRQAVYLNGEQLNINAGHRGRYIRELQLNGEVFANVYYNQSSNASELLVRSNNLFMFSRHISLPGTVFVEIVPELAKKVLTSNRDGMQYHYQDVLNAFLQELAVEKMSAVRVKNYRYSRVTNPGQSFTKKRKSAKIDVVPTKCVDVSDIIPYGANLPVAPTFKTAACVSNSNVNYSNYYTEDYKIAKHDPMIACSMITNESNCAKIRAISEKYDPAILESHTTRYKLLKLWSIFLSGVVDIFSDKYDVDVNWGLGWVFSDDADAQNTYQNGINYYLLNPIDKDGKLRYSINNKADMCKLLMLAVHEVCHHNGQGHDEFFANQLTHVASDAIVNLQTYINEYKNGL